MNQIVTELVVDSRGAVAGTSAYVQAMQAAQAAVDRLIDRQRAQDAATERGSAIMLASSNSTAAAARALERLKASIDPAYSAARLLERDIVTLDRATKFLGTSEEEAARLLSAVELKHNAVARAAKEQADEYLRLAAAGREALAADRAQNSINATLDVRSGQSGSARASAAVFEDAMRESDRMAVQAALLRTQIDPLGVAQQRLNAELAEYDALARSGVISTGELAQAHQLAQQRFKETADALNQGAGAGKASVYQLNNLRLQLFDVGQMLALGQAPLMTLLQQGPQIAQIYGPDEGGVTRAFKEMGNMIVGTAAKFPLITAGALVASAVLGGMTYEINQATDASVGLGDVAVGVFQALVDVIEDQLKPAIDAISPWFEAAWNSIISGVKYVGNTIINSFRAVFSDLKFIFTQFPNIVAVAIGGAANLVVRGVEAMINYVIEGMNAVIRKVSTWAESLPDVLKPEGGFGMKEFDPVKLGGVDISTNRSELKQANDNHAKDIQNILSSDPLGSFYDKVKDKAISRALEDQKDKTKGASDAYRDLIKNANDRLDQMRLEIDTIGKTGIEADKLRFEQKLLADAMDRGRKITPEQRKEIHALAEEYGNLATKLATARLAQDLLFERQQAFRNPIDQRIASELQQRGLPIDFDSEAAAAIRYNEQLYIARDLTFDFASTLAQDLRNGVEPIEALTNAFGRLADKLLDMALDNAINSLFSNLAGGGNSGSGGSGGGWLGSLFSWLGFASGGAFGPSGLTAFANGGAFTNSIVSSPTLFKFANGTGLMGEAGPEAIMPLRRNSAGQLGVVAANQNGTVIHIYDQRRSGAPVITEEGLGPNGERQVRVMIRDALEEFDGTLPAKVEGKVDAMQQNPRRRGGGW